MLHVVEGAPDLTKTEAMIAARAEQLDRLISDEQPKHLNVRTFVRRGKPDGEIVGYAKEVQAQLIIMTARGGDAIEAPSLARLPIM